MKVASPKTQLTFGIGSIKTHHMSSRLFNMERHVEVLQEAFVNLTSRVANLKVQTKEGFLVTLNKDLLLFFSPVLRPLLSSSTTECLLVLPDIPRKALLDLADLLCIGGCRHPCEPADIFRAAACLGIKMSKLRPEPVCPNQRNYESKSSFRIFKDQVLAEEHEEEERRREERRREENKLKEDHKRELNRYAEMRISEKVKAQGMKRKAPENTTRAKAQKTSSMEKEVPVIKEGESNKEMVKLLRCQVCEATYPSLSQLRQHSTNHFVRNINAKFSHLIGESGTECLVCGYVAKSKYDVVQHLGCHHGKVNDILHDMGFPAI